MQLVKNKDGSFSFNSSAGFIKNQYKFQLNEEFDEIGMLNDRCKSMIIFHGKYTLKEVFFSEYF